MRLLLIGAPGSGKGTQAVRIADHFGIAHISSGDILRDHVKRGTATGRKAAEYVSRGDLVPDGIVKDILRKPVVQANAEGGYVLDGFPRTVEQAETVYMVAKDLGVQVQVAAHLYVPREELIRRMLARARGAEDTAEVIAHRLEVYEERTVPLLDYYREREMLVGVNGGRPVEEVTWSVLVQLEKVRSLLT